MKEFLDRLKNLPKIRHKNSNEKGQVLCTRETIEGNLILTVEFQLKGGIEINKWVHSDNVEIID